METPMNTKLLVLATALAATATLSSAAEAGGGVRLGFGFPMGSFTATPARGGSYAASPSAAQVMAAKKKAAMQAAAARRAAASKAKVAKATNEAGDTKDTAESTPTGSTALVQTATQPAISDASSAPQADAKVTTVAAKPEPAAAPAPAVVTEPAKETKVEATKDESAGKVSQAKDLACKKFIPAVGLTVSVGCKD
jgi:predicted membrane-bound mannosyltransferase